MEKDAIRILLVEPDTDEYEFLKGVLGQAAPALGAWSQVATVAEAREKLASQHYDICLVSQKAANASGLEVFAAHGDMEVSFILLLEQDDPAFFERALQAGFAEALSKKELDGAQLQRAISHAIEHSKCRQVIKELERRRDLFAAAINSLSDGVWLTDARRHDNPIIFVNPGFCIVTGYSTAEVLGCSCHFMEGPESSLEVVRQIREAIKEKRAFQGVIRYYRRDGQPFWCGLKITPIFDNRGELTNFVGIQSDITGRREAQIALQQSEANLAVAQQIATLGSWEVNLAADSDGDRQALHWSDETFRVCGYAPGEVEPSRENLLRAVHPEDRSLVSAAIMGVTQGTPHFDIEHRMVWPDGTIRFVHARGQLIRDENGQPTKVVGTCQDITDRKNAEEALKRSNALLHAITEGTTDAIYAKDLEGRYLTMNTAGARMMGLDVQNIIGKRDDELVPPEVAQVFVETDRLAMEVGGAHSHEESPNLSGVIRTYHSMKGPLLAPDGSVIGLVGISRDVTERKQNEEALRLSQERSDILARATNDAVWDWKLVDNILWWNESFETLFGYDRAAIEPGIESWLSRIHAEDVKRIERSVLGTLENGQQFWSEEYRFRRSDGTYACILDRGFVIFDAEGKPVRMAGSMLDLTERKEHEAALLRMGQELELRVQERTAELQRASAETRTRARQQEAVAELGRRALMDIDIAALFKDATDLVRSTLDLEISTITQKVPGDNAFRVLTGLDGQSHMAEHLIDSRSGNQAQYVLASAAPTIVTDLSTETRFTPSARLLEWGVVSSLTVIIGGYEEPLGTLSAYSTKSRTFAVDDVNFLKAMANILAAALERYKAEDAMRELNVLLTEANEKLRVENAEHQLTMTSLQVAAEAHLEAKEEAERANTAKSEFLSRMSHELRTPLNAILGFGQLLDMDDLAPLQRESVNHILSGGQHLLGLINEVLDIASVEAGSAEFFIEPVDLPEVIMECCALVQPLATESGITLFNDITMEENSGTPPFVMADSHRLKQIIINLLSNAVKYNRPEGEVHVSLHQASAGHWQLRIRDSGLGLSIQDMKKLFSPFERLEAARSSIKGTGLGLVISERLTTAMGGTLGVESTLGVGSTFWIELPQSQSLAPVAE